MGISTSANVFFGIKLSFDIISELKEQIKENDKLAEDYFDWDDLVACKEKLIRPEHSDSGWSEKFDKYCDAKKAIQENLLCEIKRYSYYNADEEESEFFLIFSKSETTCYAGEAEEINTKIDTHDMIEKLRDCREYIGIGFSKPAWHVAVDVF